MPKWIKTNTLQSGDIIQVPGKILGIPMLIKHYGIVVVIDGEIKVVQNTGHKTHIADLKDVLEGRKIEKVLRTGIDKETILKKYEQCKDVPYSFWVQNCHDIVERISGVPIGVSQRITFSLILLAIVVFILLVWFSTRK